MRGRAARYLRGPFPADLVAGVTVAVVALPQSMAYAILAGAPPAFGLYASIVGGFIGSLLGSSRHLITGPANATAIVFGATLAAHDPDNLLQGIMLYTLLIGVMKFTLGAVRLGNLTHFISDSVIVGFTVGAGILIAGIQLNHLAGIYPGGLSRDFFPRMAALTGALDQANVPSLVIGVGAIVAIAGLRLIDRRIPAALIACVAAGAGVYVLGLADEGVRLTGYYGDIPPRLPPLSWYGIDLPFLREMAPEALAVAIIGLMEATSISRAVAASTGQRLDPNREFMAQGLANVGGAFFSCFASSGSLTRTALNYQAGARTRAAGMISAATVAVVVLLLGPLGQYVPIPALAGLLIVAAWQMVNRERLVLAFRAGWESACVLVVTAAAVLLVRIDWAIYIGVGLSLAFFIKQSSALYVSILIPTEDDQFQDASLEEVDPERIHGRILVLNVVGAMYFGAMDEYRAAIERTFDANPRAVILRLRRVTNLDSSGLATLKDLHEQLRDRGIPLVLCGVDRWLLRVLRHARLVRAIGEDRVLASGDLMFNSMRHALGLARELAAGESARRHAGAGSGEEAPEERG